jgi:hypothetical protein
MSLFDEVYVRFKLSRNLLRLRETESPPNYFQHQSCPPESDRGHPMRKHSEERRSLICVVGPTFSSRAPQLKEITKSRACKEREECKAIICGSQDE